MNHITHPQVHLRDRIAYDGRSVGNDRLTIRSHCPSSRQLVTLEDAATYIMKLTKAEQDLAEWQAATEALIMAAEDRGPLMHARIGMMRALNRQQLSPSQGKIACARPQVAEQRTAPEWKAAMGPLLTKRYYRRWPTHPFTHKSFRPYALALGQLALAWNDLHESLAMLFCQIMGGGYVNQFLAVWHALKSDRSQRDILAASISSHLNLPDDERLKVKKEVEWICGQANTLEDKRNDALHSPLWSMDRGLPKPTVSPLVGLGHVRANKLLGKNLLKEFRWCRDGATVLRDYALQLDEALTRGEPLPNRPSLPNRGDSNEKKPPRQERKAKP